MKRFSQMSMFLAAAVLASAGVTGLQAAPLDDRVPQDAIMYAGWAGSDALGPQYAASNLKGILDASAMKDFVNKTLPKLVEKAGTQNPNAPKMIEKLQLGLGVAWQHPVAFYFCPLDFSTPEKPGGRFGLICDAGADSKKLLDLLNEVVALNPQNPALPVHVVQDGTTVIVTFGKEESAADLKKGGGLAAVPAYKTAMNNAKNATPAIAYYVDVAKALAMVNEALAKVPNTPAEAKAQVPQAIEALGLNGLTQVALSSGFDGKGWSDHVYVGMNGPRKGILGLMDGSPLSDGLLAMVPKEAAAFSAWKLDLRKIFTESRTVIGKVDPATQKQFDAGVGQLNQAMGLDLDKDLLATLGDEWVMYQAPLSDEGGNSPALVTHLKDGATLAKSLAALEKMYNGMPNAPLKVEKITAAKTQASTLAFGGLSVAWTVKNDVLYVSSMGGIGGAIRQVESKSPSILESDLYKTARAALPANVKPLSISYTNPVKLYPELRRTAMGYIPLARTMGVEIPMELLPETGDIAQYLTPGATITWMEADGIHAMGKSAFPGADALGGQQGAPAMLAGLAVGGAVALPQLARNRVLTGGNVDASNLRGISQSTLVYAMDHKDVMPDDLARLVAEGMISPRQLVSRRAGTQPLEMTPEVEKLAKEDFAKFSELVAGHCDFVYLGKGMKAETRAEIVVAYEKPSPQTSDGLNLAYQDGHSEMVPWAAMMKAFEATNAYLKKEGKAEVDVKALLRTAGVGEAILMP